MNYLELPYRLNEVHPQDYAEQAIEAARLKAAYSIGDTLSLLLGNEDSEIADHVIAQGDVIQAAYKDGGGFYCFALGIGISALRKANPVEMVPPVNHVDWDAMVHREAELQSRFTIRTLEEEVEAALNEISDVNQGYVDGFLEAFSNPNLSPTLGFSALGTICAHDLMHFASVRE